MERIPYALIPVNTWFRPILFYYKLEESFKMCSSYGVFSFKNGKALRKIISNEHVITMQKYLPRINLPIFSKTLYSWVIR